MSATQVSSVGSVTEAVPAPKRNKISKLIVTDYATSIVIVLATIAAWELVARVFQISPSVLPAPTAIGASIVENWALLWENSLVTMRVVGLGFLFSVLLGFLLGAAIGLSPRVEAALNPILVATQAIPKIAIAPLIIVWAGYGDASALIITVLLTFFPIVLNTAHGLASLDKDFNSLGASMGASKWQMLVKLRFPQALPEIYSGLKLGAVFAVVGAVVAEFIASNSGLGYMIIMQTGQFNTPLVFAALVMLTVIGIAAFYLIVLIEKLTIPWYKAVTS